MRKLLYSVVALLLILPSVASAQTDVVAKYRVKYSTPLGPENTVKLLKEVAFEVKGGILKKTSGNNCLGYSCDFICFSDGRGFDVLRDAEGVAEPSWQGPKPIDASKCELIASNPNPGPIPEPEPEPQPGDPDIAERLKSIDINVAEIRRLLELAARRMGIQ